MARGNTREQQLNGEGHIINKDGVKVSQVLYTIDIWQSDIRGYIIILNGEKLEVGNQVMTLRLSDGKTWAFRTLGDDLSGYRVAGAGEGIVDP